MRELRMIARNPNRQVVTGSLFYILPFFMVVDVLTGASIQYLGSSNIVPLVRLLVLSLMIIAIVENHPRAMLEILFQCTVFVMLTAIIWANSSFSPEALFGTLFHWSRYLFFPVSYLFFSRVVAHEQYQGETFTTRIVETSILVIFLNQVVGIVLGLGTLTYEGFGYKGLIYAANELSGVYFFLAAIAFTKGSRIAIGWKVILVLSIVLVGTKTPLGSVLIFSALGWYASLGRTGKLAMVFWLTFAAVFFIIYLYPVLANALPILSRFEYFLQQKDSNLFSTLLSDRDMFLSRAFDSGAFFSDPTLFLFGTGKSTTVELDFFDTFLNYGVLGVLLVYGFVARVLLNGVVGVRLEASSVVVGVLFVSFSFLAGHFQFSASVGFFFGIWFGYYAQTRARTRILSSTVHEVA